MIDSHCHLEQKQFDSDMNQVIQTLKKELKAVISVATAPQDFEKGVAIAEKYKGFVFLAAGCHPEYAAQNSGPNMISVSEEQKNELVENIKKNSSRLVGIGETGLDFWWVKNEESRKIQKEWFIEFIGLANKLNLPAVVHCRNAPDETIEVLKEHPAKKVHWHMLSYRTAVPEVLKSSWMISVGPLIQNSKTIKKIARDVPLEQIMLETDSPWFGGKDAQGKPVRGTPLNIRPVAQAIAEVKKLSFEEVWQACGRNAEKFYGLKF